MLARTHVKTHTVKLRREAIRHIPVSTPGLHHVLTQTSSCIDKQILVRSCLRPSFHPPPPPLPYGRVNKSTRMCPYNNSFKLFTHRLYPWVFRTITFTSETCRNPAQYINVLLRLAALSSFTCTLCSLLLAVFAFALSSPLAFSIQSTYQCLLLSPYPLHSLVKQLTVHSSFQRLLLPHPLHLQKYRICLVKIYCLIAALSMSLSSPYPSLSLCCSSQGFCYIPYRDLPLSCPACKVAKMSFR